MLSNPDLDKPTFGILTGGEDFIFIKLVRQQAPIYGLSRKFSILNEGDLYDVLKILRHIEDYHCFKSKIGNWQNNNKLRELYSMNTAQRIYELVKAMPEEQVNEVLDFVEFIRHKATLKVGSEQLSKIPKGTLTGLRGIAKQAGSSPTDAEVQEDYTDYLMQKYQ